MADCCPICGRGYTYGPGAPSHARCQDIRESRARLDEAVAWIMSDKDERGPEPELVTRLRDEMTAST